MKKQLSGGHFVFILEKEWWWRLLLFYKSALLLIEILGWNFKLFAFATRKTTINLVGWSSRSSSGCLEANKWNFFLRFSKPYGNKNGCLLSKNNNIYNNEYF